MQDIVGGALAHEQQRLAAIVNDQIDASAKEALNRLLENPQGLHEITLLKRDPRDFSNQEIRREAERREEIQGLYALSQRLLPRLNISNENIRYYASLVDYYTVHRLEQLNESMMYVYLLCFIQHRYQRLHDNLIQSMLHHVRRHDEKAKEAAKEMVCDARVWTEWRHDRGAARCLNCLRMMASPETSRSERCVARPSPCCPPPGSMPWPTAWPRTRSFDEKAFEWQHLDKAAQTIKINLRPILHGVRV